LITRPEEFYQLWRIVVCDQETLKMRRLKPATGLWKIQPRWVVTPGKQQQTMPTFRTFSGKMRHIRLQFIDPFKDAASSSENMVPHAGMINVKYGTTCWDD
jgi:hypothetical protein